MFRKIFGQISIMILLLFVITLASSYADGVNPPNWYAGTPNMDSITTTGAACQVKFDEAVTVYYVVTSHSGSTPTKTQVRNGEDARGGSPIVSGSQAGIPADTYSYVGFSGLEDGIIYNVYLVGEDGSTDISDVGAVTSFQTTPIRPEFTVDPSVVQTTIDGIKLDVQLSETGKIYYSVYNSIGAINYQNVIDGTPDAVANGYIDITSAGTDHELLVTGLDAYSNYEIAVTAVDDNNNTMLSFWSTPFTTLGNQIIDVQYDNCMFTTKTDDIITASFNYPVGNAGADSDYVIDFDNECGGVYSSSDIRLVATTDYVVASADDSNKVTITLTEAGLSKIDESVEFDNGAVRVLIANPENLQPNMNASTGYYYSRPLDQSIISVEDDQVSLLDAVYDLNGTADLSDDKIILTVDIDMTDVGQVSDYTITLDNQAGDTYGSPDITFGSGDYTVQYGGTKRIDILFTDQGRALYADTSDAVFGIEVTNHENLVPQMDIGHNFSDADIANRDAKLSDLKVNGQRITGFSAGTFTYTQPLSYSAYKTSGGNLDSIVQATLNDNKASSVMSRSGDAHTTRVTAEDGLTKNDYVINFDIDYHESTAYLDGQSLGILDANTSTLTKELAKDTSTIPELTVTGEHPDASIEINGSGTLPGTYTYDVKVSLPSKGVKNYQVLIKADKSENTSSSGGSSSSKKDRDDDKDDRPSNNTQVNQPTTQESDTTSNKDEVSDDIQKEVASVLEKAEENQETSDTGPQGQIRENKLKEVTLKGEAPSSNGRVEVVMAPEVLTYLKENGIESTGVQVGQTALTFNQASELFESDDQLSFQFDFEHGNVLGKSPTTTEQPKAYVDVNVYKGNETLNAYDRPVKLKLEVDQFVDLTENTPTNRLTVYRLNETSNEWEPVGGKYDPVTKTITVYRMHLSKYTVMASDASFDDVADSFAKEAINELLGKGIIEASDAFYPQDYMTRAEFANWLACLYGLDDEDVVSSFNDVNSQTHYVEGIANAEKHHLVCGNGAGGFDPDTYLSYEEMAEMLGNSLMTFEGIETVDGTQNSTIGDVKKDKIAHWALEDMVIMNELEILALNHADFDPEAFVTKEMAAASIIKLLK